MFRCIFKLVYCIIDCIIWNKIIVHPMWNICDYELHLDILHSHILFKGHVLIHLILWVRLKYTFVPVIIALGILMSYLLYVVHTYLYLSISSYLTFRSLERESYFPQIKHIWHTAKYKFHFSGIVLTLIEEETLYSMSTFLSYIVVEGKECGWPYWTLLGKSMRN